MSFNLAEMDGVFRWLDVVYDGFAASRGCYFLVAIVHQRCLSQCGCVHLSKQQHILLARLCLWFCCYLSLQDLLW